MIGIYQITNKYNNKKYIGKSEKILIRWNKHLNDLMDNRHSNKKLQNDFIRFGYTGFTFEIIEICDLKNLNNLEAKYIKELSDDNYNINNPSNNNLSKNKLIHTIENYIIENYKVNETIKVHRIRKKFNLSRNKWYEIKNQMNIIKTVGTCTKRN
jgi:group I intron endonuclease